MQLQQLELYSPGINQWSDDGILVKLTEPGSLPVPPLLCLGNESSLSPSAHFPASLTSQPQLSNSTPNSLFSSLTWFSGSLSTSLPLVEFDLSYQPI